MSTDTPKKMPVRVTSFEVMQKYLYLTVDKPEGFKQVLPGQYVEIDCRPYGGPSWTCVIECNDADGLHFMVPSESTLGEYIRVSMPVAIDISGPRGGFDTSDVRGRNVTCFAAGSGVAGINPVIEDLVGRHGTCPMDCSSWQVFYSESDGNYGRIIRTDPNSVFMFETQGVLSSNPHEPILGMIAKLTGRAPIQFPNRPIVYACGPKDYVDRLREALVPVHVAEGDFRTNF